MDPDPLRDVQRAAPSAWCPRCRNEIYGGTEELCAFCRGQEERGERMTLLELSQDYREHAWVLKERLCLLKSRRADTRDEGERRVLEDRIRILQIMWREARDLVILTERYYERGYRRNAKYTI